MPHRPRRLPPPPVPMEEAAQAAVCPAFVLNPDGSEELVILRDSCLAEQLERQRNEREAAAAEPPTYKVSVGARCTPRRRPNDEHAPVLPLSYIPSLLHHCSRRHPPRTSGCGEPSPPPTPRCAARWRALMAAPITSAAAAAHRLMAASVTAAVQRKAVAVAAAGWSAWRRRMRRCGLPLTATTDNSLAAGGPLWPAPLPTPRSPAAARCRDYCACILTQCLMWMTAG